MNSLPEDCCEVSRRGFLKSGAVLAASGLIPAVAAQSQAAPTKTSAAETAVKALFETFTPEQKKEVCFSWDHQDKDRGLLRTFVSNNWQITKPTITGGFYTKKQQTIIHDIYRGLINPEWYDRFQKQLKDDNGGKPWGTFQSLAIFGEPGAEKFECVITGRHQTIRADGNTEAHVAFGGPIFYGHAAQDFNEKPNHPGNVFWPQALAANSVYKLLDEKQKKQALVDKSPRESLVGFKGAKLAGSTGISVKDLSKDQKAELQKVLMLMVEPFRKEDQEEALRCLKVSGGLDACVLSFYENSDIGDDGVWDNWRLEGPSQVWYFRGDPHVHVWVNIADSADVKLNARG
jgi:ribosomal protein S18